MNTHLNIGSSTANTWDYINPYEFRILAVDQQEQQVQIDDLRTAFNDFKSEFISTNTETRISSATNPSSYFQHNINAIELLRYANYFGQPSSLKFFKPVNVDLKTKFEQIEVTDFLERKSISTVPLHSLLKFSGAIMAAIAIASIAFWLTGKPPIFNPFISLMTLVAAPFAYLMGLAAERR